LIYQVINTLIEIVDSIDNYVFSAFRTYKLIPVILDTLVEFLYGPCEENQMFLGENKKFIATINLLMAQKDMGNYSGLYSEARSRLTIFSKCT